MPLGRKFRWAGCQRWPHCELQDVVVFRFMRLATAMCRADHNIDGTRGERVFTHLVPSRRPLPVISRPEIPAKPGVTLLLLAVVNSSFHAILPIAAICSVQHAQAQDDLERIQDDLERIKERSIEATRDAHELIPRARGTGNYALKVFRSKGGATEDVALEEGTFSIAFSGPRDFIKFQPASVNPEFDARIYINDGGAILSSSFSSRIRPYGAEGHVYTLVDDSGSPEHFGTSPHYLIRAWALLDRLDVIYAGLPVRLAEAEGLHIIEVAISTDGMVARFFLDPDKDFLLTRFQQLLPDGRELIRVEKTWSKTADNLWYVQRYSEGDFPRAEGGRGSIRSLEFTSFEPNIDVPEELFTVDALCLPVGSRIVDTRVEPNEVITVKLAMADRAALEAIVGSLPTTAVPVGTPRHQPRGIIWLIATNVGVALIIIGALIRQRMLRPRQTPQE